MQPEDIRADLEADLDPSEAEALVRLAERLERERPVPRAAFRGDLRRDLAAQSGWLARRPKRLRIVVASYLAAGTAMLGLAGLGLAGVGPFKTEGKPVVSSRGPAATQTPGAKTSPIPAHPL